jgi:hypothetical protein
VNIELCDVSLVRNAMILYVNIELSDGAVTRYAK